MAIRKRMMPLGMRQVKITLPEDVIHYYEGIANDFGGSRSGAMSPVLCAKAYGIIRDDFTQQPGADLRPK